MIQLLYKGLFHCFMLACSAGLGLFAGDVVELSATMKYLPWRRNQCVNQDEEPIRITEITSYYMNKWIEFSRSTSFIVFNTLCALPLYVFYFYFIFYHQVTTPDPEFIPWDEGIKAIQWLVYTDYMVWLTHTLSHLNESTHFMSHRRDSWYGFQSLCIHSIDWTAQLLSVSLPFFFIKPHWVTIVVLTCLALFIKVWISNEFISKQYLAYTMESPYYLHMRVHYYLHHYLYQFHKEHYRNPYMNRGMIGLVDMAMLSFK